MPVTWLYQNICSWWKIKKRSWSKAQSPVAIHGPSSNLLTIDSETSEDKRDDMFAYQKALLDYGILIFNFLRCYFRRGWGVHPSLLKMFPYVPETSGWVSYKVLLRGFVSDVPGLCNPEPTGSPSLGLGTCCKNKVWKVQHSLRFASGVLQQIN